MITEPNTRIALEQRNVQVRAFVYAAYLKPNNDVHLILGSTNRDRDGTSMIVAEVTGLPQNGDPAAIKAGRDRVKTYIRGQLSNAAMLFDDPIPVLVTGSFSYDNGHATGAVGAGPFNPNTSWEIHRGVGAGSCSGCSR